MASESALEVDSHGDLGGETSVEAATGIVMGRATAPAVGMPGVSGTSDWNEHNRRLRPFLKPLYDFREFLIGLATHFVPEEKLRSFRRYLSS